MTINKWISIHLLKLWWQVLIIQIIFLVMHETWCHIMQLASGWFGLQSKEVKPIWSNYLPDTAFGETEASITIRSVYKVIPYLVYSQMLGQAWPLIISLFLSDTDTSNYLNNPFKWKQLSKGPGWPIHIRSGLSNGLWSGLLKEWCRFGSL